MTTVNDIADILRIVREQPEWADALRGALLSQELLELPQRFAEFVAVVERRFAALESDVAELKEDVSEIKGELINIKGEISGINGDITGINDEISGIKGEISSINATLSRHSGELGNLRGANYERRIGDNISSIVSQHLHLRRIRVLKGQKAFDEIPFFELIDDAQDRGVIDQQQRIEVGHVDIVLQGQSHPEGDVVYAVLEVSVTVGNSDITRAEARAEILKKATAAPTLPVVIGANIDEARQEFAAQRGVTLIAVAD